MSSNLQSSSKSYKNSSKNPSPNLEDVTFTPSSSKTNQASKNSKNSKNSLNLNEDSKKSKSSKNSRSLKSSSKITANMADNNSDHPMNVDDPKNSMDESKMMLHDLLMSLENIFKHNHNITRKDYMQMYDAIYNICTKADKQKYDNCDNNFSTTSVHGPDSISSSDKAGLKEGL